MPKFVYPLKLFLQNTGDVDAKKGAKGQQTVEEEHHKAIVGCKENSVVKSERLKDNATYVREFRHSSDIISVWRLKDNCRGKSVIHNNTCK